MLKHKQFQPKTEEGRLRDEVRIPLNSAADGSSGSSDRGGQSSSDPVRQYTPKEVRDEVEGDDKANLTRVLLCVIFACAGSFAFGSNLGVINGPLPQIATDLGFPGDVVKQGSIVSSALFGAAFGSYLGGNYSNKAGRRIALIHFCVPMAIGALLQSFARNFVMIMTGRVLTGFGIGASSAVVPIYISEVAPEKIRGALGTLNQLVICLGILGALVVNAIVEPSQWRQIFLLTLTPIAVLFAGMAISPESPLWLKQKGDRSKANKASQQLWNKDVANIIDVGASQVKQDLQDDDGKEDDKGITVIQVLKEPKYRQVASIGMILFALQQLGGINAIVYFSSEVFKQAGLQSETLASALVGLTNVVGTVIAAFMIEKVGRKALLSVSFLTMGLCMFVLGAGFSLSQLSQYSGQIALIGTMVYIFGFALGVGPIPALITPEVLPYKIRGQGLSLALTTHWIFNFSIGQLFLVACNKFSIGSVYTFFGAVCLLGAFYSKTKLPGPKSESA